VSKRRWFDSRTRPTSISAMDSYLARHARPGQRGVARIRALTAQLDPAHPSRSTLEVKARRLLVSRGLADFVREYPLAANRRTYHFDFAFVARRTSLETTAGAGTTTAPTTSTTTRSGVSPRGRRSRSGRTTCAGSCWRRWPP